VTLDELETGDSHGQRVVLCPKDRWIEVARELREKEFELLSDLTAVDQLDNWQPHGHRFEVVANVTSLARNERLRVRIAISEDDPTCPSIVHVWPGANVMEREVYDLFGITFSGHPDLQRILMPEDWEGFPLRKDYGVGAIPVQFLEAPHPR
jgi:NADH-quinone oxidoreductase subunit C